MPLNWRTTLTVWLICLVSVCLVFWETTASLVTAWLSSGTFSHGFFIPPICAYLIWARRHRLATLRALPDGNGLVLLALLGLLWLAGRFVYVLTVQQLALVAMIPALTWTTLGWQATRVLEFPLLYLFFAVPFGEGFAPYLQDFTVEFAVALLELSNIPASVLGRHIGIPTGIWHITEDCSGLRYLVPSIALGALYVAIVYRSWVRRICFMIGLVTILIIANAVRAYAIIVLGYLTDNRFAVGVDHVVYGWIFYGLIIILSFRLGLRWREPEHNHAPGTHALEAQPCAGVGIAGGRVSLKWRGGMTIASAFLLLFIVATTPYLASSHASGNVESVPALPHSIADWTKHRDRMQDWVPRFNGAFAEARQVYRSDKETVDVYVAYFSHQDQGAELINSENGIVYHEQWIWLAKRHREAMPKDFSVEVEETVLASETAVRVMWQLYWVGGEFTSNPFHAKLLLAKAKLLNQPDSSAVIVLGAESHDSHRTAVGTLERFLKESALLERFSASE